MGINKVKYGDTTLIDLTSDTVTAETLCEGITAHGADGEQITGTYKTSGIDTSELTLADSYDLFEGVTAIGVNGEEITGEYVCVCGQYNANSDNCSAATLKIPCKFKPKFVAVILNSGNRAINTVLCAWFSSAAAVYHYIKTSTTTYGMTQETSNISSYWYYGEEEKFVVINPPSSTYSWSTYNYRVFCFK